MQVWNVLLRGSLQMQDPEKSLKIAFWTAQLCPAMSSQLRHVSTIGKKLLSSNISPRCPHNMMNFGPLAAEIVSLVWGTRANFNRFCVLAALLHGSQIVSVSQISRRWTEGASVQRREIWLTLTTWLPCSNASGPKFILWGHLGEILLLNRATIALVIGPHSSWTTACRTSAGLPCVHCVHASQINYRRQRGLFSMSQHCI